MTQLQEAYYQIQIQNRSEQQLENRLLYGFYPDVINQNRKVYFYDNGIRNMIIGNFNQLDLRLDKRALWENFLVSERRKQNFYKNTFSKMYFWRTKQQQEIDFVEENSGNISGFEFKWINKKTKFPQKFMEAYKAKGIVIDRTNFSDVVI